MISLAACCAFCVLWLDERRRRKAAERLAALRRADLAHTTRLAVVGELTGSIAHEINQPLGAILSNAEAADLLLQQSPPQIDDVRCILADIRADDLRASKIVKQIRSLLAKAEQEMLPVSLNDLVTSTLQLSQGALRRNEVRIVTRLSPDCVPVLGDRTQLQQVLMNLLLNAMDAMAQVPAAQRELVITTRLEGGDMACDVMDRGVGLNDDDRHRLFESFYTTKPDGLGLGLTISRSIMDRHQGRISLARREGGGTSASFAVPVAEPLPATVMNRQNLAIPEEAAS